MGTAFFYSLAFIYLMSAFGEILAWVMIVLIQVGLISGSVVGIYAYAKSKEIFADGDTASPSIALTLGIVLAILSAVFLCMLCFGFRSLKTAIDVIDASADFPGWNQKDYFSSSTLFLCYSHYNFLMATSSCLHL